MLQIPDFMQKRIANISVGPSTVIGQPKGTVRNGINFLCKLNLRDFSNVTEDHFVKMLDEHTVKLQKKLPSKSWGISRKVLNIFLFQAAQNIILNKEYSLDKIIPFLEVPLDNPNAHELKKLARKQGISLEWKNISELKPEASKKFQEYAKNMLLKSTLKDAI